MLDTEIEYRPDIRGLYNRDFLKQADVNNSARKAAEHRKAVKDRAERARRRRQILDRFIAKVRRPISRPIATPKPTTYARVERRLAKAAGLTLREIRGKRRDAKVVFVRHAIAYWAVRRTELSYPSIGRLMGGRDHTTILHAAKTYPAKRAKEGKHRRAAR